MVQGGSSIPLAAMEGPAITELDRLVAQVEPSFLKSASEQTRKCIETAKALHRIKSQELYKDKYSTFKTFFLNTWKDKSLKYHTARNLADAGQAWIELEVARRTFGKRVPQNVGTSRGYPRARVLTGGSNSGSSIQTNRSAGMRISSDDDSGDLTCVSTNPSNCKMPVIQAVREVVGKSAVCRWVCESPRSCSSTNRNILVLVFLRFVGFVCS